MGAVVADLEDIAAAQGIEPRDVIEAVVSRLDDAARHEFLQGLATRVITARHTHDPGAAVFEVHRWIGSWALSLDLADDPAFAAADAEATKLIEAGQLGCGVTARDLRERYGR